MRFIPSSPTRRRRQTDAAFTSEPVLPASAPAPSDHVVPADRSSFAANTLSRLDRKTKPPLPSTINDNEGRYDDPTPASEQPHKTADERICAAFGKRQREDELELDEHQRKRTSLRTSGSDSFFILTVRTCVPECSRSISLCACACPSRSVQLPIPTLLDQDANVDAHEHTEHAELLCHLHCHHRIVIQSAGPLTVTTASLPLEIVAEGDQHKIQLKNSKYSTLGNGLSDMIGLLQTCFSHCSEHFGYLDRHPSQQALLLRLLQDTCSASDLLPPVYWVSGPVRRGKVIGSGGESTVYAGECVKYGRVAVRKPRFPGDYGWSSRQGSEIVKIIHREIVSHWQLRHKHILPLLGVYRESPEEPPSMLVPVMTNGSARKYLDKCGNGEGRLLRVLHGAASGLEYLHLRHPPVIHGDLHDGNIVINQKGEALLCDFGLSRIRHETNRTQTVIRTGGRVLYVAPEILDADEERPSEAGDVYSFAMTILKLGSGAEPFAGAYKSHAAAARAARNGARPLKPPTFSGLNDVPFNILWDLIECMWLADSHARPTASVVRRMIEDIEENAAAITLLCSWRPTRAIWDETCPD